MQKVYYMYNSHYSSHEFLEWHVKCCFTISAGWYVAQLCIGIAKVPYRQVKTALFFLILMKP